MLDVNTPTPNTMVAWPCQFMLPDAACLSLHHHHLLLLLL
jgi:hypothetical protein